MTVQNVAFTDATGNVVSAVIDGVPVTSIVLNAPSFISEQVNAAIGAGLVVAPYTPPPPPVPTCQLWQLQAVMTAAQWTAAQSAVAALNNPDVSAFFAHGTNVIPANSTTLLALGVAIGLSAEQITALVQQASAVSIP